MNAHVVRRFSFFTLICALALGLVTGLTRVPLAHAIDVGDVPPEINLTALDGTKISLASLRGKVVVVDFWASWCAPCKEEMPVLESLHKRFASKGLVIIGVSVDNERENAEEFIKGVKVTFPIVHDANKKVAGSFKPPKMPTSFVIDKTGKVRFVHAGFHKDDAKKLEQEISALLK